MIDIIGILQRNVDQWGENLRCGLCWEFTAPLRLTDLNEYQSRIPSPSTGGEGCCVVVAVTDFRYSCLPGFNPVTGLKSMGSETYNFNLHFLVQGDIGVNVFNEIPGWPEEGSKWATTLGPLYECIGCGPIDFCTYLGINLQVLRWDAFPRMDWLDSGYDGWTIGVQLRNNNVT